jgi:hypothetical protein
MRLAVRGPAALRRVADEPAVVFRHTEGMPPAVAAAADQSGPPRHPNATGEAR